MIVEWWTPYDSEVKKVGNRMRPIGEMMLVVVLFGRD